MMFEQLLKKFDRKKLSPVIFVLPALLFLMGCAPLPPLHQTKNLTSQHELTATLGNPSLDQSIREYLRTQPDLTWKTEKNSTNICVFDKLDNNELFPHYLWVYCGEFTIKNNKVAELSGSSLPVQIDYPNELSYFDLTKFTHQIPGDGSLYTEDIKRIFPKELQNIVLRYDATAINDKIKEQAENELSNT